MPAPQPMKSIDPHPSSPLPPRQSSPPQLVNARDADDAMDSDADADGAKQSSPQLVNSDRDEAMDSNAEELGSGKRHQLTVERVAELANVVARLNEGARSRKSSVSSALTAISQTRVQSEVESEDSDSGEDDPMNGVGSEADSSDPEQDGDGVAQEPEDKTVSSDAALACQLAQVGLRRSCRNKSNTQSVSQSLQPVATPPLPKAVVMRKPVVNKERIIVLVSV
jgi:hypothetical protein